MNIHRYMVAGVLALVGCITPMQPSDEEGTFVGQTGLAIGVAVNEGDATDVKSIEYRIDRVACFDGEEFEPLSSTVTANLEPMTLPREFEGSPLDDDSSHPFADHFEVVAAGCYDIRATALTAGGAASADCAAAIAKDIEVEDGNTTEVFMISQCKGAAVGAVDTVVALNQPPDLVGLTYSPSKFIGKGGSVTICAAAADPNGDPIEFDWTLEDGGVCTGPSILSNTNDGGQVTECVRVTPNDTGSYWFEVRMYDLLRDEGGKLIRIEDWLREHGYPNESHDSLRFPLYVSDPGETR